jgi:hypothetical protein
MHAGMAAGLSGKVDVISQPNFACAFYQVKESCPFIGPGSTADDDDDPMMISRRGKANYIAEWYGAWYRVSTYPASIARG